MVKITPAIATQLLQINNMEAFTGWLKGTLEERKCTLMTLQGDAMTREQGRAQELQRIIDTLESARDTLHKLQKA